MMPNPPPSLTPSQPSPRLMAVIDIGSSAIRVIVAQVTAESSWKMIDHAGHPIRLGYDVFVNGFIGRSSMREALLVLGNFREMLSAWQLESKDVHTIATSAIREAKNRDQFIDRVALRTGFSVQILEGVETNLLSFRAVHHALAPRWSRMRRGNTFIVEVGGGSTEIMLLRRGEMVSSHSLHLGTVRTLHQLPRLPDAYGNLSRLLRDTIQTTVRELTNEIAIARIRQFVALGGEIRLVSRFAGTQVDALLRIIGKNEFTTFFHDIAPLTVEQIVTRLGISYDEAEPLVPALHLFRHFLDATAATELVVPLVSIREGLLLTLSRDPSGKVQSEFVNQIRASACALGQKYTFEREHADRVCAHALALFDQFSTEHGLNVHHRLLLETGAILHDIGRYINVSSHHKHSQYLIQNSEIFGLSNHDVRIISQVVRYHRKSLPSPSHTPFQSLAREDRLAVMKLAALLRIADALDTSHTGAIRSFSLEKRTEECIVHCRTSGSITAEQHALASKGNLFEEVFGSAIRLESAGN